MPEPTIDERVRELREAIAKWKAFSHVLDCLAFERETLIPLYCRHMPAILEALERQRNTLLTIEAKSKDEQGPLMHSINRLAREALNEQ